MEIAYYENVENSLNEEKSMVDTGYKAADHTEVELLTGKCMNIMHGLIKDYKELATQIKLHDERVSQPGKTNTFKENNFEVDENQIDEEKYTGYQENKTFKEIDSWIKEVNQNILTVKQYDSDKDIRPVQAIDVNIQDLDLTSSKIVEENHIVQPQPNIPVESTFNDNVEVHYCYKEKNNRSNILEIVDKPCYTKNMQNKYNSVMNRYREIDKSDRLASKHVEEKRTFVYHEESAPEHGNNYNIFTRPTVANVKHENEPVELSDRQKFDSTPLSDVEWSIKVTIGDNKSNGRDTESDIDNDTDGLSNYDVWTTYVVNNPDVDEFDEGRFRERHECASEIESEVQPESDIILLAPTIKDSYIEDTEVIIISKKKKDNVDILNQSTSLLKENNIIVISKNDLKDVLQVLDENSCEKMQILTRDMIESDDLLLNHLYASLAAPDEEEDEEEEEYKLDIENDEDENYSEHYYMYDNKTVDNTSSIEQKTLNDTDSFVETVYLRSKNDSIDDYEYQYPEPEYVSDVLMRYQYQEYFLKENKNQLYKLLIEEDESIWKTRDKEENCQNKSCNDGILKVISEAYQTASSDIETNSGMSDESRYSYLTDIYNTKSGTAEKAYSEISYDVFVEKHTKHRVLERQL